MKKKAARRIANTGVLLVAVAFVISSLYQIIDAVFVKRLP